MTRPAHLAIEFGKAETANAIRQNLCSN